MGDVPGIKATLLPVVCVSNSLSLLWGSQKLDSTEPSLVYFFLYACIYHL